MKEVAKALIKTDDEEYLLLRRSEHPRFPNDPDLPGGTVEPDEDAELAVKREVQEEVGIDIDSITKLYEGSEHSAHGTNYHLYLACIKGKPKITISWEHDSYAWVSRDELLKQCGQARDTYMKMVAEIMSTLHSTVD